jgi:hypothetical protein
VLVVVSVVGWEPHSGRVACVIFTLPGSAWGVRELSRGCPLPGVFVGSCPPVGGGGCVV